jgi:hypothetical protein
MTRLRSLCVATLLALLCLTGCSGGGTGTDATGGGTTDPTANGTTGSNGTNNGSGGGTNGSGNSGSEGFVYVPWGPDDPPIPTQYAGMAASSGTSPNCGGVAESKPEGEFWETVVAVCRAITGDGPWPERTTVPDSPPAPNEYQACLDQELGQMVQAALRWHADNPNRRPVVSYPSSSSRSSCQARIYNVRVLTADDLVSGEGYPEGKVGIAITGSALDQDPTLTVDGGSVEFTGDFNVDQPPGDGLTTLVVLALAQPQPRTATIRVETYRGVLEATVDLPGAEESSGTTHGSTSTTDESTPTSDSTESPASTDTSIGTSTGTSTETLSAAGLPAQSGQSSNAVS